MDSLKLRFAQQGRDELPLAIGVNAIGRDPQGGPALGPVAADAQSAVRFCVDRRGVWLTVAEGMRGVHVNGREVRRMAMLRVGDAIYLDGVEMRLMADRVPVPVSSLPDDAPERADDPRIVLRGVGGQYHGRSFTLQRPRLIGSAREADIRIDDPAFPERHARIELIGEHILLRDLSSTEGSEVNGDPVNDAVLLPGDQVVFDAHHRFVVEAPVRMRNSQPGHEVRAEDDPADAEHPPAAAAPRSGLLKWPWLLLAALVLAALLSLLLLFGSG